MPVEAFAVAVEITIATAATTMPNASLHQLLSVDADSTAAAAVSSYVFVTDWY